MWLCSVVFCVGVVCVLGGVFLCGGCFVGLHHLMCLQGCRVSRCLWVVVRWCVLCGLWCGWGWWLWGVRLLGVLCWCVGVGGGVLQ